MTLFGNVVKQGRCKMGLREQKYEKNVYSDVLSLVEMKKRYLPVLNMLGENLTYGFAGVKDNRTFVKVFPILFHLFMTDMPTPAMKVACYIVLHLKWDENAMLFDINLCRDAIKYSRNKDVKKGLDWLCEHDLIRYGNDNPKEIHFNPLYALNGVITNREGIELNNKKKKQ